MDASIFIISFDSLIRNESSSEFDALDFLMTLNQKFDSLASLSAMDIFAMKSDLLCAPWASSTFAPTDVPDLVSCFESTQLLGMLSNVLQNSTIFTAKSKVLS